MKKSSRKPAKQSLEVYDSLDTPVAIWEKVHNTMDLTWLMKNRKPKVGRKILSLLTKAWEKMYAEYISEFYFSEEFVSTKQKEINIWVMRMQLITTGDRTLETFIEIEEQELAEMKKGGTKANFMQTKMAIEKRMGFHLPMAKISIREFYSYLSFLK